MWGGGGPGWSGGRAKDKEILPPTWGTAHHPHQIGHIVGRQQRLQELSCDVCVRLA
jgi:hypothetical protein